MKFITKDSSARKEQLCFFCLQYLHKKIIFFSLVKSLSLKSGVAMWLVCQNIKSGMSLNTGSGHPLFFFFLAKNFILIAYCWLVQGTNSRVIIWVTKLLPQSNYRLNVFVFHSGPLVPFFILSDVTSLMPHSTGQSGLFVISLKFTVSIASFFIYTWLYGLVPLFQENTSNWEVLGIW